MNLTLKTGTAASSTIHVVPCPDCGHLTQLDHCAGDWIGTCFEHDEPVYWFEDLR